MAAQAYCPKLRNRLFELARDWMRSDALGCGQKYRMIRGGCRQGNVVNQLSRAQVVNSQPNGVPFGCIAPPLGLASATTKTTRGR